jgi:hypothetical protein
MKKLLTASFISALLSFPSFAADPVVQEKLIVQGNVVQLKDGGTIVLDKDGKTYHADANGKRVRMKDGVVMEGKDGRKYLHKNDLVWQQITEKGTMAPNR